MLQLLKQKRGQVISAEYVLVFFLVVGVMTAMTVYIKRGIQGRLRDARYGMVDTIVERTGGEFTGNIYRSYEPYYTDTDANIIRASSVEKRLGSSATFAGGVFNKLINEGSSAQVISVTAPPNEAD